MIRSPRRIAIVAALTAAVLSSMEAQTPPPGSIFDLAVSHPGVLSSYEFFQLSFTASLSSTTLSFAFRNDPSFFGFDDALVTTGGGPNLLADPGFESSGDRQSVPTGWGLWRQPVTLAFSETESAQSPWFCLGGPPVWPSLTSHSGNRFWCDGAYQGYEALYQVIPTTIGATYSVSWWLANIYGPGIGPPTNPTLDMLVYATSGLPEGATLIAAAPVSVVPEPAAVSLLAIGLAGVAGLARRRRST